MSGSTLVAAGPLLAAAALPVALLLLNSLGRRNGPALVLSLAGFGAVLSLLPGAADRAPLQLTSLLQLDGAALYFVALATLAGAATVLLLGAGSNRDDDRGPLYLLLAIAVLGAAILATSRHFASLFLGLELVSVPLFPLIAFPRHAPSALEAGIKYLVMSAVGTALLLFGAALIYAGTGNLEFAAIGLALAGPAQLSTLGGLILVLAGLAVKLSLVPLHWWTPDVYQGAPAAVAGFLSTVSKGAVLMALLRLFGEAGALGQEALSTPLGALAILSMLGGNLLALRQSDVKRMLAGSSIAHMGYLMVAIVAVDRLGSEAVAFYLAAYFITMLGAFGAVSLIQPEGDPSHASLERLRGLHRNRPWLALSFTAMLLSLAGLPVTAGFVGKFYLFAAGLHAHLWSLVGVLAVSSVIGLFYYLRTVALLYAAPSPEAAAKPPLRSPTAGALALTALTLALIWAGLYPGGLIGLIRAVGFPDTL
jgi:NADH-quinone oxidoreductase subunit N